RRKAAEHTGAKPLKRTGLKKPREVLEQALGEAAEVFNDEKSAQVWLKGGAGQNLASLILGASTAEVVGERKRIAKDAASAVQAAVQGGIVAGGGAAELAAVKLVEKARSSVKGMAAYGLSCVVEALKRPMAQIISNSGFNPLEKLEDVLAAQTESGLNSLALDCESGNVCDMQKLGVWDPLPVKKQALKAAGEIAEAILRIDTIIKKKDGEAPKA
ncbi:MAG: TCP-1/cpn60 chaperonin family protein, partial [Clostridia bacterium]|nr:TCP-1/cpn60 chaperonin family protein [Clostridia bacterium]